MTPSIRWSLRSVFVFVTLVCVALAWFAHRRNQLDREALLVHALQTHCSDADIILGPVQMVPGKNGAWDRRPITRSPTFWESVEMRYFKAKHLSVVRIRDNRRLHPAIAARLSDGIHLTYFSAPWSNLNQGDVAALSRLRTIEYLHLNGPHIDDNCLQLVTNLSELRLLDVAGTNITDEGLNYLRDFQQLEMLNVWGTPVRGPGFRHLQSLPNLKYLSASRDHLNKESLLLLADCPQLKEPDVRALLNEKQTTGIGAQHARE